MNAAESRCRDGHGSARYLPWGEGLGHASAQAITVTTDPPVDLSVDRLAAPRRIPRSEAELLDWLCGAAEALEFECCTIGMRLPFPLTRPRLVILGNHPERWGRWYVERASASIVDSGGADPASSAAGDVGCRSIEDL